MHQVGNNKKQDAILLELKTILRIRNGVPFKCLQKLMGKLHHASIGIPMGKYLFRPINQLMAIELKLIFWDRVKASKQALKDWSKIIHKASKESTHVNKIVVGNTIYKDMLDASGEGTCGVLLQGTKPIAPEV